MEDKKRFYSKILPFHTMYIMADLSTSEKYKNYIFLVNESRNIYCYMNSTFTMNDECVLCCIKIDSNGTIVMKPSFSRNSYYVQTTGFARGRFF